MAKTLDSLKTRATLKVQGKSYTYYSLRKLREGGVKHLAVMPFSIKILLENLLRCEDGVTVTRKDIENILKWDPKSEPQNETQFMPARVVLQDFTGVPCVADLAAMRDALKSVGGDAKRINPLQPADLVIDHSVQVDFFGSSEALSKNAAIEFDRNKERYAFLRWGQSALKNFGVVPPDTGIVHQVNIEHLARVAMTWEQDGETLLYPDTVVGTDSHTTMVNGLGVLGWGVGGIEAEAAMLGQPITMLIPQVVGFKLIGKMPTGATATDLVLTVTQMLRKKGVVGKFVEFYGPGLAHLTLADRATIANMAPEYGATCGIFPVDHQTLDYMRLTGRSEAAVSLVEAYYKEQELFAGPETPEATYSDTLSLDLATIEPCLAGPSRPQDRVVLSAVRQSFRKAAVTTLEKKLGGADKEKISQWMGDSSQRYEQSPELASAHPEAGLGALGATVSLSEGSYKYNLTHGSVVIAAITSCTNTSNPAVLMAAGLLAKKAADKGMKTKPWVKTSLAPGSKAVTEYLKKAGLLSSLETLGFHVVGYGCTTCIGNSGPLPEHIDSGIKKGELVVAAVLSGNRNFEGRIHPRIRANYLASPPLVVAYALAGNVNLDLAKDPLGKDKNGKPVYLKDIWPSAEEVQELVRQSVTRDIFERVYAQASEGDANWRGIHVSQGDLYQWDDSSTYIKKPPFFEGFGPQPKPIQDVHGARVLALLGDSVTTDHISPAGDIDAESPAGKYLKSLGVEKRDFNSYGARRGNHEVMMRGTFANIRLKNLLVPGVEGGVTMHAPSGQQMSIYDAAVKYQQEGTPLVVVAGKEYGTGSSRDWAAKGTMLLGARAVIVESFERIHRSNLVGMGVLPLQFLEGESRQTLGITGQETFEITGLSHLKPGQNLKVKMTDATGKSRTFDVRVRIDTPNELEYYKNGGILQYVLRQQMKGK